jgi:internalin A
MHFVESLNFRNCSNITSAGLQYGLHLPLREITLNSANVDNSVMPLMKKWTKLDLLDISDTTIGSEGVKSLVGHPSMTRLYMKNCVNLDDSCGLYAAQIPKLGHLVLGNTRIGDRCIKNLAGSNVGALYLKETKITSACADDMVALKHLSHLDVNGTAIDDKFLKKISTMKTLVHLNLIGCSGVTLQGIEDFRHKLPHCEVLAN